MSDLSAFLANKEMWNGLSGLENDHSLQTVPGELVPGQLGTGKGWFRLSQILSLFPNVKYCKNIKTQIFVSNIVRHIQHRSKYSFRGATAITLTAPITHTPFIWHFSYCLDGHLVSMCYSICQFPILYPRPIIEEENQGITTILLCKSIQRPGIYFSAKVRQ